MTRRGGGCLLSAFILVLEGLVVWLEPTRVLWGKLRGEAFFQGRPTSYWARQIVRWNDVSERKAFGVGNTSRWDQAMEWLGLEMAPTEPAVLILEPATMPVLLELLGSEYAPVQYGAIFAFGNPPNEQADQAIGQLRAALTHRQPIVRYWAAIFLAMKSDDASLDRALPVLVEAMQRGDVVERAGSAGALAQLGPKAQAAIAPVRALHATTTDSKVREIAENTLREIDPPLP